MLEIKDIQSAFETIFERRSTMNTKNDMHHVVLLQSISEEVPSDKLKKIPIAIFHFEFIFLRFFEHFATLNHNI